MSVVINGNQFYYDQVGGAWMDGTGPAGGVILAPAVAMANSASSGVITIDGDVTTVKSISTADVSINYADVTGAFVSAGDSTLGTATHIPVPVSVQQEIDNATLVGTQASLFSDPTLMPYQGFPAWAAKIIQQVTRKIEANNELILWSGSAGNSFYTNTTPITGLVAQVDSGNQLTATIYSYSAITTAGVVTTGSAHNLTTGEFLKIKTDTTSGGAPTIGGTTIVGTRFRVKVLTSTTFQIVNETTGAGVTLSKASTGGTYSSINTFSVQDAFANALAQLPARVTYSSIIAEEQPSFCVSYDVMQAYKRANASAASLKTGLIQGALPATLPSSNIVTDVYLNYRVVAIPNMQAGTVMLGKQENFRWGSNIASQYNQPTVGLASQWSSLLAQTTRFRADFMLSALLAFPTEAASVTL